MSRVSDRGPPSSAVLAVDTRKGRTRSCEEGYGSDQTFLCGNRGGSRPCRPWKWGGVTQVDVFPPISDQERDFVRRTDLPLGPSQWEASRHATVEG